MEQKTIYVIVDSGGNYLDACFDALERIKRAATRRKWSIKELSDPEDLIDYPELTVVALVGSRAEWVQSMIAQLRARGLRIILIGGVAASFGEDVSSILCSGNSSVKEIVSYYCSCSRKRIALVGIDSNANYDQVRITNFLEISRELRLGLTDDDIYYVNPESDNPVELFLRDLRQYDGVICTNDYIATFILSHCASVGVKIPEELYVSGLGDTDICRFVEPTLTSASRNNSEIAEQIFDVWMRLTQNPQIMSVSIKVRGEINPRGSTAYQPVQVPVLRRSVRPTPPRSDDVNCSVRRIKALCNTISSCDDLDLHIIHELLEKKSIEDISEELFTSIGTVRYRLKKLYELAEVTSKAEFISLFRKYISSKAVFEEL